MFKIIPSLFLKSALSINSEGFFLYVKNKRSDSIRNYIVITSSFDPDKFEINTLLSEISKGNSIFISALSFNSQLLDTLHLRHEYQYESMIPDFTKKNQKKVFFTNPKLKSEKGFLVENNLANHYFSSFDTLSTIILGKDESEKVNFIKIKFGKGTIFINTLPLLFTNYNLLYGNREYVISVLSHFQQTHLVWDDYYKPNASKVSTPIRYILSQPSLKAAYLLLIIALLIYIIFESRRKQRTIPILKQPKNNTLEFVETVGRLYINNANHKDIALKKFAFLKEKIMNKYHFDKFENTENFKELLEEKSGIDMQLISSILESYETIKNQAKISEIELVDFNKKIDNFGF